MSELIFLGGVLAVTLAFAISGLEYGEDASLLPWIISGVLCVLTCAAVIRVVRSTANVQLSSESFYPDFKRQASIFGGLFLAYGLTRLIGLVPMAFAFSWLFIGFESGRWLLGFFVGLVLALMIYGLGYLLGVSFPEPLLLAWVKS